MFFLFAKIRYVILYVLVCGACCFAAYDPSPILPDTVFVEDSIAVEEGYSRCDTGAQSCIVVGRGCREEYFAVNEKIDPNEPEDSLLARVYGAEPLQDSSRIYGQWASNCKEENANARKGIMFFNFFLGGVATAMGVGLFYIDYEHTATEIVGKTFGGLYLVTGVILLLEFVAMPIIWQFRSPDERIQKYEEREKAWKLRVTPTINFNEPGGGLLLQLGF